MPKLDIRHLQMLEAVAGEVTLAAAADRLSITPSALTHRVREAERRIGAPLLARGQRGVALTPAGVRLLEVAARCLKELDQAEWDAGRGVTAHVDVVRIGASTLSGYEWLPDLLRGIAASGLPIEVEIALDVSLNPVQALRERRIDVAIMPGRAALGSTRSLPLFRDEMVVVLPVGHAKGRLPYLEAEDLLDEPYITDGTTRETGREFERLFEPSGVRPQRVLRAGHTEAVIALVRAGFGLTILSRRTAEPYLDPAGLTAVPLTSKGLFLEWHAVLRKDSFRSSPARTVSDLLDASARVDRSRTKRRRAVG